MDAAIKMGMSDNFCIFYRDFLSMEFGDSTHPVDTKAETLARPF